MRATFCILAVCGGGGGGVNVAHVFFCVSEKTYGTRARMHFNNSIESVCDKRKLNLSHACDQLPYSNSLFYKM